MISVVWRTEVTEEWSACFTAADLAAALNLSEGEVVERARKGTLAEVWNPAELLPDLERCDADNVMVSERRITRAVSVGQVEQV